jgi:dTDP-4-amino-4,6-dideoxygalactose transaminase
MIPLLDLKAQYASIKTEVDAAVLRVLASGTYVLGEEVEAFERDFAAFCNTRHAIAMNSGTSALHLSLLAAGIGPGDEVITVPFTFIATVSAICYAGATPVFIDVDPITLTMDPAKLEEAITPRTRAIIPVHLYGQMADMDPIMHIAEAHGLHVVEDACQAHGAEYLGSRAGSMGLSGCFSFYPGKNLGACGEGGIAVTNDDEQAQTMRMLRDWGQSRRYHHAVKGFNYRMDALQGAILRVKLRHLEDWTEARRLHARCYAALLGGSRHLRPPVEAVGRRHVYHVFAIQSEDRESLQEALRQAVVSTGLHYPVPVHLQEAHSDLGYRRGDFPVSETAAASVLSLPMYPELTVEQIALIAKTLEQPAYAL